jgi:hypothetical protein
MRLTVYLSLLVITLTSLTAADRFASLWYDGNAEISTYRLTEHRYGEERIGSRVMVFVTEPLRMSTHIKPDTRLADSLIIPVIKLNDLRQFTTGIYDYHVMTSVFAAAEARHGIGLMSTVKASFSAQEWCGQTFERIRRREERYEGALYSYFESEGEQNYAIDHDNEVEAEENLWILVRELRGPVLADGAAKTIRVIPSMWSRRKAHEAVRVTAGRLTKGSPEKRRYPIGVRTARRFVWAVDGDQTHIWVEAAYPHRILAWQEPDGSRGTIIASVREPYWKLHDNKHLKYRQRLELSQK